MYDSISHIFSGGKVIINILILKVFIGQIAFGQTTEADFCGTPDLTSYIESLGQIDIQAGVRRSTIDYYPIQVFSVAQSNGDGRLSELEMRKGLCTLNEDFLEYGLQFYLKGPIKDINNDDYFDHTQANGYKMMRNNNVTGAFNVYIVKNPNETCGYFSPANEAVAISQSCFIGGTHALTHEMGHYFGLPHTFLGWEKRTYDETNVPVYLSVRGRDTVYVETLDGNNCSFSGDGFCDTPPDYISERWSCTGDGVSTKVYVDPNGAEFFVDGTNYMSYAQDRCQNMFSPQQVDRMYTTLDTRYSSRRYKFVPPSKVSGVDMNLTSPSDQADVDLDEVELSWDPLPDAEEYIVQISILSGVLFDKYNKILTYRTTDTKLSIPSNELKSELKYYWRVIPLNSFTLCLEPSGQSSFTPQVKSSTHILPDGDQIRVFPNLFRAGNSNVQIFYKFSTPRNLRLSLFNVSGQLLSSVDQKVLGDTESSFYTGNLNAGLYILHISDGKSVVTQKLMVQ